MPKKLGIVDDDFLLKEVAELLYNKCLIGRGKLIFARPLQST